MSLLTDTVRAYLEEVRLAVIGTTNRDCTAHQTALWYALRDDTILMNTVVASKKVRNIKRNPRASVCIVDSSQPRHVTLEGTVELDDRHVIEDLTALASRYAGKEAGPGIAQNISRIPHISLVLHIERVKTFGKV